MKIENMSYEELAEKYMDVSTELSNISALIIKLQEEQTTLGKLFNQINDQLELLENLEQSNSSIKN